MDFIHKLLNPENYPHQPDEIVLKQTHASYVFIAKPFVYKIKKNVNFGFLDFSTIKKRKWDCIKEIYLNQKLAEGVYLNLIKIKLEENQIKFDIVASAEEIIRKPSKVFFKIKEEENSEFAIQMQFFEDKYFLKNQEITYDKLDLVSEKLYHYYKNSRTIHRDSKKCIFDNLDNIKNFINITIDPFVYRFIKKFNKYYFKKNYKIFTNRIKYNKIKECHGDLHLEHIIFKENQIFIYDCIEFNKEFRQIDVANDIAFLCMDLDYYGYYEKSKYFIKKMYHFLKDKELIILQDLFRCYRAAVRGKVYSLKSLNPNLNNGEKKHSIEIAKKYFALSFKYALTGINPIIIIFMGRIGSGKSTIAHKVAKYFDTSVFSSDLIRKNFFGIPLYEKTPLEFKKAVYSSFITSIVYNRMMDLAIEESRKKGVSILDGTFATRKLRNIAVFKAFYEDINILFVEIDTRKDIVIQRLAKRKESKNEISDATVDEYLQFYESYQPPLEIPLFQRIKISIFKERDLNQTIYYVIKKIMLHNLHYKKFIV